jgi:hypothetical protein
VLSFRAVSSNALGVDEAALIHQIATAAAAAAEEEEEKPQQPENAAELDTLRMGQR